MTFPQAFVACATLVVSAVPAPAQDGGSMLDYIDAARQAADICPDLRLNEQRIAELATTLNTPQALIAKTVDETEMALLEPSPPPPPITGAEPPTAGAPPPGAAIDPACGIALAEFGPDGTKLAGLLEKNP